MEANPDRLTRELFVRSALDLISGETAARLADGLTPLDVSAGTVLFEKGDASGHFYLVSEGKLALEDDGQTPAYFGPRALVGIVDMTLERPRQRRCRAITDSRLFVADAKLWLDLIDEDPSVGRAAVLRAACQLYDLSLQLRERATRPAPRRVALPAPPLPLYEKILVLREVAFLQNAGIQATASLAQVAEELRLSTGETLFAAGHAGEALYIVADGAIELEDEALHWRTLWGASELVGGAAALCRKLDACSAVARSPCVLLKVAEEDYSDQTDEHPELTRAALAYLVGERDALVRRFPEVA
ncbi:MAG TPA: cyclic nucleotide-binding domain-containing protein [Polyangiaceae bacterium]|nr:cyclic nucleotide-binding domain-containing protein [Polyangiaceae bacterium]